MMEGPGADSEEKHEPASDIDIEVADSLKVLDLKWPIREADIVTNAGFRRYGQKQSASSARESDAEGERPS
jgi:hypothetical protein